MTHKLFQQRNIVNVTRKKNTITMMAALLRIEDQQKIILHSNILRSKTLRYYLLITFVLLILILHLFFKPTVEERIVYRRTGFHVKFLSQRNNNKSSNNNSSLLWESLFVLSKEVLEIKSIMTDMKTDRGQHKTLLYKPVHKLVRASQDTGVYVHSNVGLALCGARTLKILVLVMSIYDEISERFAIRNSWASEMNYLKTNSGNQELIWKSIFVVGTPSNNKWPGSQVFDIELKTKRDILRAELQEHHTMQGVKLYSALMWAFNNCNFKYVLVTSAQYYLNIPILFDFIHQDLPLKLYAGKIRTKNILVPKLSTNRDVWVNKTKTFIDGSMILSFNLLSEAINSLKSYSNIRSIDPTIMVSEAMEQIHIKPWSIKNFIIESNCTLKKKHVLNYESNLECFDALHKQSSSRN